MRTAIMAFAAGLSVLQAPPTTAQAPARSGHVEANGVKYYYEIHGTGEPLLHGGLGSIGMFGDALPKLAERRQVIAVDLHAHGRTGLSSRKIHPVDIGNDLAILLTRLGMKQVDALGYSFGGASALRLAIQHPAMVRRLVLVSAGYSQDGFHPEMLPMQAAVGANWSAEVKQLAMPVMLVYGDGDMFRPDHVVSFYRLLSGGLRDAGWMREHMSKNRLVILPDLTHYEMFLSPAWVTTVLPFLNGVSGSKSWADQVRNP